MMAKTSGVRCVCAGGFSLDAGGIPSMGWAYLGVHAAVHCVSVSGTASLSMGSAHHRSPPLRKEDECLQYCPERSSYVLLLRSPCPAERCVTRATVRSGGSAWVPLSDPTSSTGAASLHVFVTPGHALQCCTSKMQRTRIVTRR